jgi:hypothetical protein
LAFLGLILMPQPRLAKQSTGLGVIALYILGLVWLWYCNSSYHQHWYPHLGVGLLMIAPLLILGAVSLVDCGAVDVRRARLQVGKLFRRTHWPTDLTLCQSLPEVLELQDAIQNEASPALALLDHARVEIRAAALSALSYRVHWRPWQAEFVQAVVQRSEQPAVRAAAIRALAFSRDALVVETLAKSLRDEAPEVRRAAAEVLFWDSERRWGWVRFGVHEALSDPQLGDDGPLPLGGVDLPPQAVEDLNEWASEGGQTTIRASLTLANYYGHVLNARPDREAIAAELQDKVLNPQAPTRLRIELAHLLFEQNLLDRAALEGLLAHDHPVSLRLLGVDAILLSGPFPPAVATLRQIARMPNREIALDVAQIAQRRLGVDLGLDLLKPPAPQSRTGAEITRRVMQWAAHTPTDDAEPDQDDDRPVRSTAKSRPDSEWDLPPLQSRASDSSPGPSPRVGHY